MASVIYLETKDVPEVFRRAFPEYTGRKWKVQVTESVRLSGNYWEGGSKSDYMGVDLATGNVGSPERAEYGNPFTNPQIPTVALQAGKAIVEHSIFCGKDAGCTIYVHADNFAALLPAAPSLTEDECTVLEFTASLKSSYGGDGQYRFHEAQRVNGITAERWEAAKVACIGKGLLDKRGAVTPAGRNARASNPMPRRY